MADLVIIGAFIVAAIGILMMILVALGSRRPEDWDIEVDQPDVDPTTGRWRSQQVEAERRRLHLVDPDHGEVDRAGSDNQKPTPGPGRPPDRKIP
jgi:hypothetical protein